jgi:hypothetical protein
MLGELRSEIQSKQKGNSGREEEDGTIYRLSKEEARNVEAAGLGNDDFP